MEGDLLAQLLVDCHSQQLMQFDKFDPFNTRDVRKLRLVLAGLTTSKYRQRLHDSLQYHAAVLSCAKLAAESASQHLELLKDTFVSLYPQSSDTTTENSTNSLKENFHQLIGRPGEERYEAMLAQFTKPVTSADTAAEEDIRKKAAAIRQQQAGDGNG